MTWIDKPLPEVVVNRHNDIVGEAVETSTDGLRAHGAAWLTAGAAALSAVVATVAVIVNAASGGASDPRTGTSAAPAEAPASASTRSVPIGDRSLAIDAVAFVDNAPGPRYAFHGTAEIDAKREAIYVLARPVVSSEQAAVASEENQERRWIESNAAKLGADGTWTASIRRPPLPGGPIEFVPIVMRRSEPSGGKSSGGSHWAANASAGGRTSGPACPTGTSLSEDGPAYCKVLDAGNVRTYAP